MEDSKNFARELGYPIIARPSYVLSGQGMKVIWSEEELESLRASIKLSEEHPLVISKFMKAAREVDVDGVADGEDVFIGAVIEHLERAGIHSGDAIMCIPPQTLSEKALNIVEEYTAKIAKALQIRGPFNIQYIVRNDDAYVIECNLRASRSIPFVSKTRGVNLMDISAKVLLGGKIKDLGMDRPPPFEHVGVKVPMFSYMRLSGADTLLGVEMHSTGEVACLGDSFEDALGKALESADFRIPLSGSSVLVSVGGKEKKTVITPFIWALSKEGFKIYATLRTAGVLREEKMKGVTTLHKIRQMSRKPNIADFIRTKKLDLVINIPAEGSEVVKDGYAIRRLAVEFNVPIMTTLELVAALVTVIRHRRRYESKISSLNDYMDALPWKYW